MTARFNVLFRGSADDAANELEHNQRPVETTVDELRLALINALRKIDALERKLTTARPSAFYRAAGGGPG